MSSAPISLKGRALRLLSGREHSRAELARKLKAYAQEPAELTRVLHDLQAKGLINDQRVVESVIHRRSAKLGAARIKQELQSKGLDSGVVLDAVLGLQATELERAREVWRKKFGASPLTADRPEAVSATERARQMRFLASRGFSSDAIRRVVAGASDDQDLTAG